MARFHTPIGWSLAVALAASVAPAPAPAQSAAAASSSIFQVNTGRGRLVNLRAPMSDLFVADQEIADVQVRSPTQLYIFGKKPGETTVSATTKTGRVVYATTVRVGNNYDSIGTMLRMAMPDAKIVATPMNGLVLLTGTVAAPADAAEAERLTQAYVGDAIKVLSRLKTATPLQVNLQVRFAEVSKSFIKNVGVNLTNRDKGGFLFSIAQGRQGSISVVPGAPPARFVNGAGVDADGNALPVDANGAYPGSTLFKQPAATVGTLIGAAGRLFGTDLLGSLDLGETIGQVSMLANPNLSALSGETGTFLAGGEVPIPIAQGLGTVSVEYKQYGISLAYTPTVLSDGRISLRVRPEVSQLDYSNAVVLNGTRVPGLTTRRAETTLELGSGQSMMIGGLLQNSRNNGFEKTPGIGDVPVLGALFRSNAWQRNETELVIVITPYLVKPVDASEIRLPTDGEEGPTDLSRILGGTLGTGRNGGRRPVPTYAAPVQAAPAIGAAAPAASAPVAPVAPSVPVAPGDPRLDGIVAPPSPKQGKGATPAPGFSVN